MPEMAACADINGGQEMEADGEYTPTAEQIEQEEKEKPLMMTNAARWDRFLALVAANQKAWPQGVQDTDDYRKARALEFFTLAVPIVRDLIQLKPSMRSWVPHILFFIVPRQMVDLGDPVRRACDSCESFGAMLKKIIKHSTCRRRLHTDTSTTHCAKVTAGSTARRWKQTFKKGYIQQAFTRAAVRESLQHGAANVAYMQRADYQRTMAGRLTKHVKNADPDATPVTTRDIHTLCSEMDASTS